MQARKLVRQEKHLILVGGGHAHIEVLRRWAMKPLANVRLSLISPSAEALYSGMVPGYIAGDLAWGELTIDLQGLARQAGAIFIRSHVTKIDSKIKIIELSERPNLQYDVLSVNVGSRSRTISGAKDCASILQTRPLSTLLNTLHRWDTILSERKAQLRLVGVGAGAAGIEMMAALLARANKRGYTGKIETTLIEGKSGISKHRRSALTSLGVSVIEGALVDRVEELADGSIKIIDSRAERIADFLVLALGAEAPTLFAESGLANARGFLSVDENLSAIAAKDIFGAGDAVDFKASPGLDKAGVFAVREGPILYSNLVAALEEGERKKYRPQKRYLRLLNLSQGEAILEYGPFSRHSACALAWKNWIDRKFMERYRQPILPPEAEPDCQACGGKVAADALIEALKPWHKIEDVAEIQVDLVRLAWSIDHFSGEGFEPFLFGRILSAHALSDIYAKGLDPIGALANVVVPRSRRHIARDNLQHILAGVRAVLSEVGMPNLLGGQSTEGDGFTGGLTVLAKADRLWPKCGLMPGDALLQTHALGSGVLLAAAMRGQLSGEEYYLLCERLGKPHNQLSKILKRFSVRAATDITGFGLAGHLSEMIGDSDLRLEISELAVLPRATELLAQGYRSRMQAENERSFPRFLAKLPPIAFDPQTNGGFLVALPESEVGECLSAIRPWAPEARRIAKVL